MSWNQTNFEQQLKQRLIEELGEQHGNSMLASFVTTRDKVLKEIRQIPGVEPNLSDHGPDHIADVMDNAQMLISNNFVVHGFSAIDLYVLALVILFHDVGNLFGRENHHVRIGLVFDWARGTAPEVRREKTLVIKAARAHTGTSSLGDRNTLVEVDQSDHLYGRHVQLRNIAAVLRFADELAEGPQRTTDFFRTQIGYSQDSKLFHKYAASANVAADRPNERIRLTYEIQLNDFASNEPAERRTELVAFLTFVLHRVAKLDEERRYARFYCPLLGAFKQTDVVINFADQGQILPIDVRFQLDDLVVPGEHKTSFEQQFPSKCKTPAAIADEVFAVANKGVHSK